VIMHVYVCACVYMCMCVCMYVCMCVFMCVIIRPIRSSGMNVCKIGG